MIRDFDLFLDTLDRAHTGSVVKTFDWDSKVIPRNVKKYLKKYNLEKTCDPKNPVNTDDELADRFFQAGMELAEETGILCVDTHRVLKFTQDEIHSGLEKALTEFTLGEGKDTVTMKARKPEDRRTPIFCGPLSIQVSEEYFKPILEGIARIPEVDMVEGPSLLTIHGRDVRGESPYEVLAGKYHAELMNEVLAKVDRPGMARDVCGTAPTHYGIMGSYGLSEGYKPGRDLVLAMNPAEIKTGYDSLYRIAHVYNAGHNGRFLVGSYGYIGGSAGGPEGAALCNIANTILVYTAYQATISSCGIFDVRYLGNTDRNAQWALGIMAQAFSRNTKAPIAPTVNSRAGPVTKMLLYENAVGMMNITTSGVAYTVGVRSAGGRCLNHLTPLEHEFGAKVFKACAGMSREEANRIAQQLIPKYENELKTPSDGKSYAESYNQKTLEPTNEWQQIYDEVSREIQELGIPID